MLTDGYLCIIQRGNLFPKRLLQFIVKFSDELILLIFRRLQSVCYICPQAEEAFGERLCLNGFATIGMLTEVFKVIAPVEYLESLLMLASSIDVLAQTGTSTYHLHELDFRPYLLEEY